MPREVRYKKRINPRAYKPTTEETPSGICECGCGKGPTGIAPRTERIKRWFKGFPVPYLSGHSPARLKRGPEHPNWRGRKRISKKGYIWVRSNHPSTPKCGIIPEHRLIMSEMLGRTLRSDETVHYINENRKDNRPENLQLRQKDHGEGIRYQCFDCGSHNVSPIPL